MRSNSSSAWKIIRKLFNKIHLYAGLSCGLIVIAVCFSGTIYVYNTEIREFFDSELYFVEEAGERKSPERLKIILEKSQESKVIAVNWNEETDRSVQFTLKKETEEGRGNTFFVNPYSGEIIGNSSDKTSTAEFMGYMFSLHRWLLLDRVEEPILESMGNRDLGRLINGIATLLFLIGVITGIVIWVPNKVKNWKQGLKIKWSGNWKRTNHDLHNTLAFYSLIFLFIMAATGPFWSFTWYREGYQKTFDTFVSPKQKEAEKNVALPIFIKNQDITLDDILAKTDQTFDFEGSLRISLPASESEVISVRKYKSGFFAGTGSDELHMSPENLEILEVKLFSDLSFRQQIGRSVKALHTGEIFGQFSKFLWFLACAVATSLPITGTLIWWNKRKKKSFYRKPKQSRQVEMA
ncbi:MAG: PepSY-associated TM helix domain-containing protein [Algoriphagus sp.]|uniref:PepSY-associated TM helix domain-containing protein n=1 Tax=Algoriphagus sp. TaxID=1872435 RepID=UPI002622ABAB|nr:PepSY-associated TM helix domain-containing protein [Algoriphagus sp.]MDG1277793.1 PepSY-associated TM helix domain-containing protein [Algoriphagus sp.]